VTNHANVGVCTLCVHCERSQAAVLQRSATVRTAAVQQHYRHCYCYSTTATATAAAELLLLQLLLLKLLLAQQLLLLLLLRHRAVTVLLNDTLLLYIHRSWTR
jgi:hypothetical protein